MNLVYTWIQKYMNLEELSLQWNYQFVVEVMDEFIDIKNIEEVHYFFPDHINNVNIIVGRNGIGKTNILNLLSRNLRELRGEINLEENEGFFHLYHVQQNKYIIQGINLNAIEKFVDLSSLNEGVAEDYCITVEYDTEKKKFKALCYWYNGYDDRDNPPLAYIRYISRKDEVNILEKQGTYQYSPSNYLIDATKISDYHKAIFIEDIIQAKGNFKGIFFGKKSIYFSVHLKFVPLPEEIQIKVNHDILGILTKKTLGAKDIKKYFVLQNLENSIGNAYYSLSQREGDKAEDIIANINNFQLEEGKELEYYFNIYEYLISEIERSESYDINRWHGALYLAALKAITIIFQNLDDILFEKSEVRLSFSKNYKDIQQLTTFLELCKSIDSERDYLANLFTTEFTPFSSGELEIVHLLSGIYHGFQERDVSKHKHVIILLDEPNNFMHPEWSRRLIQLLFDFTKDLKELEGNKKLSLKQYSFIITTHSPFMLSDVTRNHVIALKNEENRTVIHNSFNKTFANNIHTLFADNFFMDNTMGEFASTKINNAFKLISKVLQNNDEPLNLTTQKEIEFLIENIGDPLIAFKLNEMYQKALSKTRSTSEKSIAERKRILEQEIEKLNYMLKELNND